MMDQIWTRLNTVGTTLNSRLYAVIDRAHGDGAARLVAPFEARGRAECLWQGASLTDFADVAPWLVALDKDGRGEDLAAALWPSNWGVFMMCRADLDGTRRALRRLTAVSGPQGQSLLMRFYDPRTLPSLLESMNETAIRSWFDPITAWICRSPTLNTATLYRLTGAGLQRTSLEGP